MQKINQKELDAQMRVIHKLFNELPDSPVKDKLIAEVATLEGNLIRGKYFVGGAND